MIKLFTLMRKIEILDILKMPSEIQVDVKGFISNEMYITPLHECVYNNDLKDQTFGKSRKLILIKCLEGLITKNHHHCEGDASVLACYLNDWTW